jgi:hypothetical protein
VDCSLFSPSAEVRPAENLAALAAGIKADLVAEAEALRNSAEAARRAGEKLKRAWVILAPQHRWHAWLKEQGISHQRASERIRIYDSWSSIPPETGSKGAAACLNWLGAQASGGDDPASGGGAPGEPPAAAGRAPAAPPPAPEFDPPPPPGARATRLAGAPAPPGGATAPDAAAGTDDEDDGTELNLTERSRR